MASATGKRRGFELRDALVVVQVAVSIVLVVGGALMVRSLAAAGRVQLGYDGDRTAYLSLALEMSGYDRERGGTIPRVGVQRLQRVPQVEAVALTSRLPLSLNNNGFGLYIDGHETADDRPSRSTARTWMSTISARSSSRCSRDEASSRRTATSRAAWQSISNAMAQR